MNKLHSDVLVKVILGAGGVGKTTVSAVLGLNQAFLGKRVLVITLDPAKRLLDALGLKSKGQRPSKVSLAKFGDEQKSSGSLHAYMPDLKKEWQDFLESTTKNTEALHKIADNPFYAYVVNGLPGALEVICSHILCRFMASGKYDVIILDTPPSSNSVAFLDVPKKVAALLEQNIFRSVFAGPKSMLLKLSRKLAFFSGSIIQNTLERLIGSHFLSETIDFALSIDSLYEPMLERSRMMNELLSSQKTKYVLVCKPDPAVINDCLNLRKSLNDRDIFISEIVINQVAKNMDEKALNHELSLFINMAKNQNSAELVTKLVHMHEENMRRQEQQIARLQGNFTGVKFCKLTAKKPRAQQEDILADLLADLLQQVC